MAGGWNSGSHTGFLSEKGHKGTLSFAVESLQPGPQPQLHHGPNHQEVSHQDKEAGGGGGAGGGPSMGSQASGLGAHSQEGETVRWPTKLLFLSQSLRAKLCGPSEGRPTDWGIKKAEVPRRGQRVPRAGAGREERWPAFSRQGSPLIPSWGDPESRAAAPSQTRSSPRAGPHGLHQSGGSPGGRRVTVREQGAISSLGLGAKTRGSLGYLCSSFLSTPPPPQ